MAIHEHDYATCSSCLLMRRRVHRALEFPASPRSMVSHSYAALHVVRYVLCAVRATAPCVRYVSPDAAPCQQSWPQHPIPLVARRALPGRNPPPSSWSGKLSKSYRTLAFASIAFVSVIIHVVANM